MAGQTVLVDARIGWGSGIGRYVAQVVPRVAKLLPGVSFDLQVPPEDLARVQADVDSSDNLTIKTCDIAAFSMAEQRHLQATAKPYDLTWFTNYWVPLRWNGRFVTTIYDTLHLEPILFPASPVKRLLARRTMQGVQRKASAIFYISRFTQREFERRFGTPRRGTAIHLGVDHAGWIPFDPESPPPKSRKMLVVAASKQHKNFQIVADAWKQADIPDGWTLTAVVPGQILRSSVDVAALLSGRAIDLQSDLSNEALRSLYSEAAVILTPSLYEGFGFPLLEGMQSGATCISSTAEALVEIAEGSHVQFVNGRDLLGWVDALQRACREFDAQADYLAPVTRHNMRHAASFRWADCAAQTAAMLDAVLSQSD
jgi:glycosyltransferase involved in cell wall biosynthesis